MRDDYRLRQLRRDLRKFLPQRSDDLDALPRLVALGYPAVEPILFDLLKWIRQPDWPVTKPIAVFLTQIGTPLTPYVEKVFRSHDQAWAAQVIREVLEHWPAEALLPLVPHLEQQAIHALWGNDLEALSLLVRNRLLPREYGRDLLGSKRHFLQEQLSRIESIDALLSDQAV
jgi:Domain of unknown function (DUF5071)